MQTSASNIEYNNELESFRSVSEDPLAHFHTCQGSQNTSFAVQMISRNRKNNSQRWSPRADHSHPAEPRNLSFQRKRGLK